MFQPLFLGSDALRFQMASYTNAFTLIGPTVLPVYTGETGAEMAVGDQREEVSKKRRISREVQTLTFLLSLRARQLRVEGPSI